MNSFVTKIMRAILGGWWKMPSAALTRRFFYRFQHVAFALTFEDDLAEWKPDIIHCNDWQTLHLGARAKKIMGSYLIFDSHELETHRNPPLSARRKAWMKRYEAKHFVHCDLISTVCDPIAEFLAKTYSIERPTVVVNSPICDEDLLSKPFERWGRVPEHSSLRGESPFFNNAFIMVAVGNVTINRGLESIINAMALLPQDICLAILGKANPNYANKLNKVAEAYGLLERVTILAPVNPAKLVPFLRTADIGLIPLIPLTMSYEFALPNKLFECAFAGLPIVASDTFEVKRVLEEYDLGLSFPAGDSAAMAEKILVYYNRRAAGEKIRKDNSRIIEDMRFEKSVRSVLNKVEQDCPPNSCMGLNCNNHSSD